MDIKFSNNASTYLVDPVTLSDTTITVTPMTGYLFPKLVNSTDFFKITVVDTDANMEIMKVTSKYGDQFTVQRAQEGTQAREFTINSIVENRLTAGSIEHILNDSYATTYKEGRVRLATDAEVLEGVSTTSAVTPSSLTSVTMIRGTIVAFAGVLSYNGFPIDMVTGKTKTDWHVCDGKYDTPDLRDRFIVGASPSKPKGSLGGTANIDMKQPTVVVGETTLTTHQMPSHNHNIWFDNNAQGGGSNATAWFAEKVERWTNSTGGSGSHTHPVTQYSGTENISILPPYYSLAYIMKL